jgi:hypothetical protein
MRYKLRTLLILLAVVPPLLWFGWDKYQEWKASRDLQRYSREAARRELQRIGPRRPH